MVQRKMSRVEGYSIGLMHSAWHQYNCYSVGKSAASDSLDDCGSSCDAEIEEFRGRCHQTVEYQGCVCNPVAHSSTLIGSLEVKCQMYTDTAELLAEYHQTLESLTENTPK
jgi:hypothetical protein